MVRKPAISLAQAIKRADDIEALYEYIEHLEYRIGVQEKNNLFLAESLTMAMKIIRRLDGKVNPSE